MERSQLRNELTQQLREKDARIEQASEAARRLAEAHKVLLVFVRVT